jgi:ABC-type transport system involved in multi-copper enzyme maturation permease subunit
VLVRDMRALFRGRRVALTQLAYLVALAIAMGIAAFAARADYAMSGFHGIRSAPDYGRWMFITLYETQVVLLLLVAVAYSAGAISLEHEKQTYDVLAITNLTSAEVVLGKVWSVSLLCWLLLLTATPLAAFCLFFGGISPGEIAFSCSLLALKVPLWAALGVIASILTGRSTSAYVVAMFAVGMENVLSFSLTAPLSSLVGPSSSPPFLSPGLFSPFLAPASADLTFRYLGWPIWPWLLPTVYAVLLTTFIVVGSAEAMDHYRPHRSRPFRGLLLAISFMLVGVLAVNLLTANVSGLILVALIVSSWIWACLFVPIFTSYPPPADSKGEDPGAIALRPKRWLDRHPVTGGGFCVLLWVVVLLGMFIPLATAALTARTASSSLPWGARAVASASALPNHLTDTPAWALAVAIGLLGIIAYSACGSVLALVHKERREAALGTVLIILAMNACAVVYALGYYVMRKPPSAAPLVLASPAAAVSAVLAQGLRGSKFARYSLDEALIYGVGYSLLLLLGAWYYYRRAQEKQRSSASSSSALDSGAAEERSEES